MKLPFSGHRYYLKFGLDRDPFPRKSPQKKVFLTHEMIHCLDQVKAAVETSDQLVVLASPPGAGKSVLSRYLGFIKPGNWFVGLIEGSCELDRETLAWEIIRQHFPERRFERSQSIYLLKEFLQLFHRNGRKPVVIIDDAHKLSPEILKFVLEIAALSYQEAQYRFVLFGDPGMYEKLHDPNLRQLIPAHYHHFRIPSLSLAQTRKYLEYRLSLCGECLEDPFTPERVQEIYQLSAGLPGEVHAPAKRIMQEHPVRGSRKRLLFQSMLTASVCLLVFTGVYSAMNDNFNAKTRRTAKSGNNVAEVIPVNLPGSGTLIRPVRIKGMDKVKEEKVKPVMVDTEPAIADKLNVSETKKSGSGGILAWLFGLIEDPAKNKSRRIQAQTDRSHLVVSLDRRLSLRLSDIIEK